jgi:hypothetical protein
MNVLLKKDIDLAWKHAIRAYNNCENFGFTDSQSGLKNIVVKLSQEKEYIDSMCDNGETK